MNSQPVLTYNVTDDEYNTIKKQIDDAIEALGREEDNGLQERTAEKLTALLRGLRPNHWLKHRVYRYVSKFPEAHDATTALGEIWRKHERESSEIRQINYPTAPPPAPVASPSAPILTNAGFNRPYPPWHSGSASSGEAFYHIQGTRNPAGVPPGTFHAPATMYQGYAYDAIPGPPPNSQEGPSRGRRRYPQYGQPSQAQAPANLQPNGYGPGPAYYPAQGQGGYPTPQGPNSGAYYYQ
ncbi:hypothetical protein C8R47DRAFT_1125232 [Mycena vitilis]|nr:hypothetical protein C8R47DRAFT_1125232 [Mycena vitilis]